MITKARNFLCKQTILTLVLLSACSSWNDSGCCQFALLLAKAHAALSDFDAHVQAHTDDVLTSPPQMASPSGFALPFRPPVSHPPLGASVPILCN